MKEKIKSSKILLKKAFVHVLVVRSILGSVRIPFYCVFIFIQKVAKKGIYLTPYLYNERIFDRRPFMYNKIFLKKLLWKFVALIFTLLLAPFAQKVGQLFETQRVFEQSEEFRNGRHFLSMRAICRFSKIL